MIGRLLEMLLAGQQQPKFPAAPNGRPHTGTRAAKRAAEKQRRKRGRK